MPSPAGCFREQPDRSLRKLTFSSYHIHHRHIHTYSDPLYLPLVQGWAVCQCVSKPASTRDQSCPENSRGVWMSDWAWWEHSPWMLHVLTHLCQLGETGPHCRNNRGLFPAHTTAVMAPLGLCHTLTSLRGPSEASLSPCVLAKSPQQQWKWWGASQVGQWLRFHAPHAGNTGLVPGGMTRFCLPQLRPVCSMAQSCLALHNPMDCSPPGSSVHGISRARILEQVAISFSRETSWPVPHCQHHLGSPSKIWCDQTNFLKSI